MGWRIAEETQRYGPEGLTWRELYALQVLSNDANEHTRLCRPGIEDGADMIRRLRCGSRAQRYKVMASLVDKGAIERVQRGQKHRQTVYRIARFAPVDNSSQGPVNRDAEEFLRVSERESQGLGTGISGSRKPRPLPSTQEPKTDRARESDCPPWDRPDVLSVVKDSLEELSGKTVSDDHARREAKRLLDGRTVSDACAYVKGALRKAAEEGRLADHLPGYQPPPYRAPDRSHLPEAWR